MKKALGTLEKVDLREVFLNIFQICTHYRHNAITIYVIYEKDIFDNTIFWITNIMC